MVSKIQKIYVKELHVSYEQLMSTWMASDFVSPEHSEQTAGWFLF